MGKLAHRFSVRALAAGAAVLGSATAFADISNVVFSITAENSQGIAHWEGTLDQGSWSGQQYNWSAGGIDLQDEDGDIIGTLGSASIMMMADPIVVVFFDVQAGAADTLFTFGSGLLSFPAIGGATGSATTAMTLNDADGDGSAALDGAGGSSGGMSWQANYNGLAPAGTIFAEFVPGMSVVGPDLHDEASASTGGFQPIPGSISSMSVAYNFVLSAEDSASGTSAFVVVPEPASLLLLIGGLLAIRRR